MPPCACVGRTTCQERWRAGSGHRRRAVTVPRAPALLGSALTIDDFAYLVAVGLGATRHRSDASRWELDLRHSVGAQKGRLPMCFYARAVSAPSELGGGTAPVDASCVHVPQIDRAAYAPHARLALVFVEQSPTPVLPHEFLPMGDGGESRRERAEQLYWRLVSTDSCEAVHCGALLTLRSLCESGIGVVDERGDTIVEFGMQNALRHHPFTRHLMLPRAGCTIERRARGLPVVRVSEPPREAAHGAVMHQVVWARTRSGRELVMDFTGAQYGVEDRHPVTGTPFWHADVASADSDGLVRGFELTGQTALFSGHGALREMVESGPLANPMHAHIGTWIRDSALSVLEHRRAVARNSRTGLQM
jgi:hypothetical protein